MTLRNSVDTPAGRSRTVQAKLRRRVHHIQCHIGPHYTRGTQVRIATPCNARAKDKRSRCNCEDWIVYHFVWPPLASITAKQRSLIFRTYFEKSESSSLAHSSCANWRTCSAVFGSLFPIRYFSKRQTFLIGLRSGE